MSGPSLDEETLARIVAPPERTQRCSRCAHAEERHIDQRDNTVRGCQARWGAPHYRCDCDGFLLLFARSWPENRLYQVQTEQTTNWSLTFSDKHLIPLDYTPPVTAGQIGFVVFVFGLGVAVGVGIMWGIA